MTSISITIYGINEIVYKAIVKLTIIMIFSDINN